MPLCTENRALLTVIASISEAIKSDFISIYAHCFFKTSRRERKGFAEFTEQ